MYFGQNPADLAGHYGLELYGVSKKFRKRLALCLIVYHCNR